MTNSHRHEIPLALLRSVFILKRGSVLIWQTRPREHFPSNRAWNTWNARYAGKPAGVLRDDGYILVQLTFGGRKYRPMAHCVIFALTKGSLA
jgi:hypothetical protein